MKKHLSLSQRIHNAEGAQMAEYLHAKHSYLHAKNCGKEEWGYIWSRSDDVSWAHAFGRWRGWEDVWYANVSAYTWKGLQMYEKLYDALPEITWLDDFRGLNEISFHALTTDIIEVADDGGSARGYFVTPGFIISAANPNLKYRAGMLWERYGSDFVFEDGEWKYLHEQVCPDTGGNLDVGNPGVEDYQKLFNPPEPMMDMADMPSMGGQSAEMERLADPGPLHNNYTLLQTVQDTVPWPKPYVTMDENNTYTKKKKK